MPIWSPEFETMPRDQLERLQAQRLRELVARAGVAVPFYKRKLADAKVSACLSSGASTSSRSSSRERCSPSRTLSRTITKVRSCRS